MINIELNKYEQVRDKLEWFEIDDQKILNTPPRLRTIRSATDRDDEWNSLDQGA